MFEEFINRRAERMDELNIDGWKICQNAELFCFGIDAVLLTPTSCDPLNRRAVRVSMGSVFLVPWTWLDAPIGRLNDLGFRTAAMALTDNSIPIDNPALTAEPKLAIIMGTEGDGLSRETIAGSDYVVRIPMSHGVDSLNVAAAAAVAFWQLRTPASGK